MNIGNKTIIPLINFMWHGDNFAITEYMHIQRAEIEKYLTFFEKSPYLSHNDIDKIKHACHWLIIEDNHPIFDTQKPDESIIELMNQFFTILWINCSSRARPPHPLNHAMRQKLFCKARLLRRKCWIALLRKSIEAFLSQASATAVPVLD